MKQVYKDIFKAARQEGAQDTWLTPPEIIKSLGPFNLDPCCPQGMPWRTARRMISLPQDGLAVKWNGRVWCNPPYSDPLPWVKKMTEHESGIMLLPANPDTRYAQLALKHSSSVVFIKGRLLFHYVDGTCSKGKWMKNMLVAFSEKDAAILKAAFCKDKLGCDGVYMRTAL